MRIQYCTTVLIFFNGSRINLMNEEKLTIYHNPKCSKSRETLSILKDNNKTPEIIQYLKQPISSQALRNIVTKLNVSPKELVRTADQAYKDTGLEIDSMTDGEVIEAICNHPEILQRPIVICGDKAVIGRPPGNVLDII